MSDTTVSEIQVPSSDASNGESAPNSGETMEMDHLTSSDETKTCEDEGLWGRLLPLNPKYNPFALIKNVYTFGREVTCDYVFKNKSRSVYVTSKLHFKLSRHLEADGYVELEDCSRNGTFVNGKKVGTGKKKVLVNNDEISLCSPEMKAFVYVAVNSKEDPEFPEEVRNIYTVCKVLGSGACGEVRLAFENGTCRRFAIKIISKRTFGLVASSSESSHNMVMNEVRVLKELKHPCIIKIEDVIDTEETLYIVLQLVEGGELFDRIESGKLTEFQSKIIFYQLLLAIKYLHDKGITHRDLKPENVLLTSDDDETLIKVTDFGISKIVDANTMLKTFCGTPNYLAPEIITTNGTGSYTNAIDLWSLGIVLHCCLVGYQPFSEENAAQMTLYKQICSGNCEFPDKFWSKISEQAKDLVQRLLQVEPQNRITISEALNHEWLKDDKMLEKVKRLMSEADEDWSIKSPSLKRSRDGSNDDENGLEPEPKQMAV